MNNNNVNNKGNIEQKKLINKVGGEMLGYGKPDILHKIKNFGKSSQTQPTNFYYLKTSSKFLNKKLSYDRKVVYKYWEKLLD